MRQRDPDVLFDNISSKKYFLGDIKNSNNSSRRHYAFLIEELSKKYGGKASLDLGCGTGRYFPNVKDNTSQLFGIDPSKNMMSFSKKRFKGPSSNIFLINADPFVYDFRNQKFDFIYSIGVLGEYVPLNDINMVKILSLLKSGGLLFFTVVNNSTRISGFESSNYSFSFFSYLSFIFKLVDSQSLLSHKLRRLINKLLGSHYSDIEKIEATLNSHSDVSFNIFNHEHKEGWSGSHFDILAIKK